MHAGDLPGRAAGEEAPRAQPTAPQTRKWTQGDKTGDCAVTNAAGLIAALRSSGAVVSEDVSILVKTSKFGKTNLVALMASSTTSAVDAPVLAAEFDVVLSVPEEATAVLMQVRSCKKTEPQTRQGVIRAPPWPRRGVRTPIPHGVRTTQRLAFAAAATSSLLLRPGLFPARSSRLPRVPRQEGRWATARASTARSEVNYSPSISARQARRVGRARCAVLASHPLRRALSTSIPGCALD